MKGSHLTAALRDKSGEQALGTRASGAWWSGESDEDDAWMEEVRKVEVEFSSDPKLRLNDDHARVAGDD